MQVKDLKLDKRNYNKHNDENKRLIKKSIDECGFGRSVVIDDDNEVICGNGVVSTLDDNTNIKVVETDGNELVVIRRKDLKRTDEKRDKLAIMDNSTGKLSEWDYDLLKEDFEEDYLNSLGIELPEIEIVEENMSEGNGQELQPQKLSEKFLIPPFDIFDGKTGQWLERKRIWKNLICDNAEARNEAKAYNNEQTNDKEKYKHNGVMPNETSILDPVLSEIINMWFTPYKKCKTFDCFAGDTVFGYVSSYLGNFFTGIELRQEQADFNNKQTKGLNAKYICDDGQNVCNHIELESQDLLFSCPPYFDLEVYSDLENDASNQDSYEDFIKILDNAFSNAIKCLKNNRFAVIVVGDVRDKKTGAYYNFPNDIIDIFTKNDLILYNNIKLLTPYRTAQIRAGRYMNTRKTVHVYQDVLVFYKGDTKNIKDNFGEVEVAEIESTDV